MKDSEPINVSHDPWLEVVNASAFAYAAGYVPFDNIPGAIHVNEELLRLGIHPDHIWIELYARYPSEEASPDGVEAFRFPLPASLHDWFQRLCRADRLRQDTPITRQDFLEAYQVAQEFLETPA